MSLAIALLLFAAGLAGGAINAVAGGATLLTFPVLIFAGLPPIIANATSSVALTPGHLFAVISERKKLPALTSAFWVAVGIAAMGGVIGAYLLFVTTERLFTLIVPLLIGLATLIFAFGKKLQSALAKPDHGDHPLARLLLLVPVGVYGGYFGAGMGVVLMAAFSMTSNWELRTANAMKNLLGAAANWAAIGIFLWTGMVHWPSALTMLAGACLGGLLGARLLKSMPTSAIRLMVIAAGSLMTVIYIWRYWF